MAQKLRCRNCHALVKPHSRLGQSQERCPRCGFSLLDGTQADEPQAAPPQHLRPALTSPSLRSGAPRPATAAPGAKTQTPPTPATNFKLIAPHLVSERHDVPTRSRLFQRLCESFEQGLRDPELLYLAARFAVSLGLPEEASRFLGELRGLLHDGERLAPAYFPVGLLSLQLAQADEQAALRRDLETLAADSPQLAAALRLAGHASGEQPPPGSPQLLLREIKRGAGAGSVEGLLRLIRPDGARSAGAAPGRIADLPHLAASARAHYRAGELNRARRALEDMLLADGDQPDVLRNLVTIAGEQQEVEAYERYWRRYVGLLLWRIMRGELAQAAYDDLIRFYAKVAKATDREFNATPDRLAERLHTPGLLARWLEAHAGLVWLDTVIRPHRDQQANLSSREQRSGGRAGHLSLMKYWFRVFYPEFRGFLDPAALAPEPLASGGKDTPPRAAATRPPLRRDRTRTRLNFDPALVLLTRFAEWSDIHFALNVVEEVRAGDEDGPPETVTVIADDEHTERVMALAGCVARVPLRPYVLRLQEKFGARQRDDAPPFRRLWQEACGLPFRDRRDRLMNEEKWAELVALYDVDEGRDVEALAKMTPMARLFIAFALCRDGRESGGLEVACELLPDLLPDELDAEGHTLRWWRTVLQLNLNKAFTERSDAALARLRGRLEALRGPSLLPAASEFVADCLREVEEFKRRTLTDELMKKIGASMQQRNYAAARQHAQGLPSSGEDDRKFKHSVLEQIELEKVFDDACALIRDARKPVAVEKAPPSSAADPVAQAFKKAVASVNKAPAEGEAAAERKQEMLTQLRDAEREHRESELLNSRVDAAVSRAKELVQKGDFSQARQAINRLPDVPPELVKLKRKYIAQIDDAERQAALDKRIDAAVNRARSLVQKRKYAEAKQEIKSLPNSPAEVAELKRKFIEQIDEEQRNEMAVTAENSRLLRTLSGKGIDRQKIYRIGQDNNLDLSNPYEFNALLKAIEKQIRGY